MLRICGIDEAGRGPCAGPLVFAGVILDKNIQGLDDSKKLTPKKREILFEQIVQNSTYHIVFKDNTLIDQQGLSLCIKQSLQEIIHTLGKNDYIFDGNSSYGVANLAHLIKADESIAEVSAASILAKVSRDRYMDKISLKYPQYQFDKHKGYPTKLHKQMIKEYGYCDIHRLSYKIKL